MRSTEKYQHMAYIGVRGVRDCTRFLWVMTRSHLNQMMICMMSLCHYNHTYICTTICSSSWVEPNLRGNGGLGCKPIPSFVMLQNISSPIKLLRFRHHVCNYSTLGSTTLTTVNTLLNYSQHGSWLKFVRVLVALIRSHANITLSPMKCWIGVNVTIEMQQSD